MVQLFGLIPCLKADVDAQLLQQHLVLLTENHREVGVAAPELWHLPLGQVRQGIGQGGDGQGQQHLVGVEAGVLVAQVSRFSAGRPAPIPGRKSARSGGRCSPGP